MPGRTGVPIRFEEAIPIAVLGLAVNVASAWLLSSGGRHHGHDHGHGHGHNEEHGVATPIGTLVLSVFETDHPPVFRVRADGELAAEAVAIEMVRPDGSRQSFSMADRGGYLQSVEEIPEPHEFVASVMVGGTSTAVVFEEHANGHNANGSAQRTATTT